MSKTITGLKTYIPYNEQEEADKKYFIECEQKLGDILHRTNSLCHLCSSAFIVNAQKTKVLSTYHNIYNSWTWVGGHADGDDDMLYVALKEAKEETSLQNIKVLSTTPIAIDSLPVSSHYKHGKFVPAHTHLNFTYLLQANETEPIQIKPDENSQIAWLTFDQLVQNSTEPYMQSVYKKIISRLPNFK